MYVSFSEDAVVWRMVT